MTRKHVRAKNAKEAWEKGSSKNRVVTKVNYIGPDTKKGKFKIYDVTTKKREK